MILPTATTSEIIGLLEEVNDWSGECDKIAALKIIKGKISTRNLEGYFRVIINWGRDAELIGYRGDEDEIYLR
jgi:hypothetical protein